MENKDELVNDLLPEIAKDIKNKLPEGYGFIVFAFQFGDADDRRMMYISNANRDDALKALQEFSDKMKDQNNYGKDI